MNKDLVDSMLKDLMYELDLETLWPGQSTIVLSLKNYNSENGFLTPKQTELLQKIHREVFS